MVAGVAQLAVDCTAYGSYFNTAGTFKPRFYYNAAAYSAISFAGASCNAVGGGVQRCQTTAFITSAISITNTFQGIRLTPAPGLTAANYMVNASILAGGVDNFLQNVGNKLTGQSRLEDLPTRKSPHGGLRGYRASPITVIADRSLYADIQECIGIEKANKANPGVKFHFIDNILSLNAIIQSTKTGTIFLITDANKEGMMQLGGQVIPPNTLNIPVKEVEFGFAACNLSKQYTEHAARNGAMVCRSTTYTGLGEGKDFVYESCSDGMPRPMPITDFMPAGREHLGASAGTAPVTMRASTFDPSPEAFKAGWSDAKARFEALNARVSGSLTLRPEERKELLDSLSMLMDYQERRGHELDAASARDLENTIDRLCTLTHPVEREKAYLREVELPKFLARIPGEIEQASRVRFLGDTPVLRSKEDRANYAVYQQLKSEYEGAKGKSDPYHKAVRGALAHLDPKYSVEANETWEQYVAAQQHLPYYGPQLRDESTPQSAADTYGPELLNPLPPKWEISATDEIRAALPDAAMGALSILTSLARERLEVEARIRAFSDTAKARVIKQYGSLEAAAEDYNQSSHGQTTSDRTLALLALLLTREQVQAFPVQAALLLHLSLQYFSATLNRVKYAEFERLINENYAKETPITAAGVSVETAEKPGYLEYVDAQTLLSSAEGEKPVLRAGHPWVMAALDDELLTWRPKKPQQQAKLVALFEGYKYSELISGKNKQAIKTLSVEEKLEFGLQTLVHIYLTKGESSADRSYGHEMMKSYLSDAGRRARLAGKRQTILARQKAVLSTALEPLADISKVEVLMHAAKTEHAFCAEYLAEQALYQKDRCTLDQQVAAFMAALIEALGKEKPLDEESEKIIKTQYRRYLIGDAHQPEEDKSWFAAMEQAFFPGQALGGNFARIGLTDASSTLSTSTLSGALSAAASVAGAVQSLGSSLWTLWKTVTTEPTVTPEQLQAAIERLCSKHIDKTMDVATEWLPTLKALGIKVDIVTAQSFGLVSHERRLICTQALVPKHDGASGQLARLLNKGFGEAWNKTRRKTLLIPIYDSERKHTFILQASHTEGVIQFSVVDSAFVFKTDKMGNHRLDHDAYHAIQQMIASLNCPGLLVDGVLQYCTETLQQRGSTECGQHAAINAKALAQTGKPADQKTLRQGFGVIENAAFKIRAEAKLAASLSSEPVHQRVTSVFMGKAEEGKKQDVPTPIGP